MCNRTSDRRLKSLITHRSWCLLTIKCACSVAKLFSVFDIFASSPEHFDWVCGMFFLSFFYFVYCIITHSTVPSMLSRMSLRGGSEKKEAELIFKKSFCVVLKKFPVTTPLLVLGVVNAENELHEANPGNANVLCAIIFSSEKRFSIEHDSGIFSSSFYWASYDRVSEYEA